MDTYGGSLSDPMSLHKYLFANSNPVMYSDPSGHFSLAEMDLSMAIDRILDSAIMSGILYCVDANATDPEHEHHDIFGYFGAIGLGIIFGAVVIMLSSTLVGLLILAIINTILGVVGTIKGVLDILNGHPVYGGLEIILSTLLTWFGWRNYIGARNAAKSINEFENHGKASDNSGKPTPKEKPGPKPKGTGDHNIKIEEVASQVKDGEVIAGGGRGYPPEAKIPTPNGIKTHRRPDILVRKTDNSVYGINVGKTTAKGAPIKREVEAIYDLENAGIPMWFVAYDK